jgi:transposase
LRHHRHDGRFPESSGRQGCSGCGPIGKRRMIGGVVVCPELGTRYPAAV